MSETHTEANVSVVPNTTEVTHSEVRTETTTGEDRERSNMVTSWVSVMDQLLDALHSSYSDDPSSPNYDATVGPLIASKRNDFKSLVLTIDALQEKAVRAWHDAMMPFYELCRAKKAEPIIAAKCWVLEEIQFSHIWQDPRLNEASKDTLWSYVNGLNTYANMYCALPSSLQAKVESIAERCEAAGFDGDVSKMGIKDVLQMSAQAWQGLDANDIKDFTSNLPQLFDAVGGEGGIRHVLTEMGAPQFASVFESAISYSQTVMRGEEPDMDMGSMLSSVMSSFGGLGGEASSGGHGSGGTEESKGE